MPRFERNVSVTTGEPQVRVDVTPDDALPIGRNRFRLTVVDDSGNESAPAVVDVIVRDRQAPTAILDIVDADGRRITPVVEHGEPFHLSGARSMDLPPGRVVEYRFTLLDED